MKANSIEDALNLFDPHRPLVEEDDLKAYYVSRANSPIDEMKIVLKSATDFPKLLLSGPPGCGKSTELGQLKEMLKKDYHVILFSVKKISNVMEISLEEILFYILSKIAEKAKEAKLSIYHDRTEKFMQRGFGWENAYEYTTTLKGCKGDNLGPGDDLFGRSKNSCAEIDSSHKVVWKASSEFGADSILELINDTVWDLEEKTKKDVLVLVTDMDKIDLEIITSLLTKFSLYLIKLNCFAVYTIPLELKYKNDFIDVYRHFTGIYFLPNFNLVDREGAPVENHQQQLRDIIAKRMSPKLIYDEAIDLIVQLSGGVVFELINLVRQCCIVALMEKIKFIDEEVVKITEERIRKVYNMVYTTEERKLLFDIHTSKKFISSGSFVKLLKQFSFTEYGTGDEVWYDVNPVLLPLIKNMKPETENTTQGGERGQNLS